MQTCGLRNKLSSEVLQHGVDNIKRLTASDGIIAGSRITSNTFTQVAILKFFATHGANTDYGEIWHNGEDPPLRQITLW